MRMIRLPRLTLCTQVDWVARSVAELQAIDPEIAAFVTECDERDAREVCVASSPTGPANQGVTMPGAGGLSTQSKGIKKSFPCFWLPVSVCVASRVHSLLSACPQSSRIDSIVQPVTVAPGTEASPIICFLTSGGLSLVNHRRKGVRAGSVCQLSPPLDRPTCEFMHCPCSVYDQFRAGPTSWKTALCIKQSECKCPHCRSAFNSQGHWDPAKMDRLCTIRDLSGEKTSSRTILRGVWQTLQRTPLRKWLSLEPPRCYVAPMMHTWTPQEWRVIKKDTRLGLRDNGKAFLANEDRRHLRIHSEKGDCQQITLDSSAQDRVHSTTHGLCQAYSIYWP